MHLHSFLITDLSHYENDKDLWEFPSLTTVTCSSCVDVTVTVPPVIGAVGVNVTSISSPFTGPTKVKTVSSRLSPATMSMQYLYSQFESMAIRISYPMWKPPSPQSCFDDPPSLLLMWLSSSSSVLSAEQRGGGVVVVVVVVVDVVVEVVVVDVVVPAN